jgi:hypothetical protein
MVGVPVLRKGWLPVTLPACLPAPSACQRSILPHPTLPHPCILQEDYVEAAVKQAITIHLRDPPGDILIFMTGEGLAGQGQGTAVNPACHTCTYLLRLLQLQDASTHCA